MTTNAHGETAKVIQFPKGGRAGLSDRSYGAHAPQHLTSVPIAYVDCGSGSYHDAAIREADRSHDR